MKICSVCKKEKAASEFNKHIRRKDGLQGQCKKCRRAVNKKWRQRKGLINQVKTDEEIFTGSEKRCFYCKEDLPRTRQFWERANTKKDGLASECRECGSISGGRATAKRGGYAFDAGTITGKELRTLKLLGCYFKTPLCSKGTLVLEHNHKTGKIRGYVCNFHNVYCIPGLEEMAQLQTKEEFNHWLQFIFNPPAKAYYQNSSPIINY